MMDHRYIDDFRIAENYLANALTPEERKEFSDHAAECDECWDRLQLAKIWLEKDPAWIEGIRKKKQQTESAPAHTISGSSTERSTANGHATAVLQSHDAAIPDPNGGPEKFAATPSQTNTNGSNGDRSDLNGPGCIGYDYVSAGTKRGPWAANRARSHAENPAARETAAPKAESTSSTSSSPSLPSNPSLPDDPSLEPAVSLTPVVSLPPILEETSAAALASSTVLETASENASETWETLHVVTAMEVSERAVGSQALMRIDKTRTVMTYFKPWQVPAFTTLAALLGVALEVIHAQQIELARRVQEQSRQKSTPADLPFMARFIMQFEPWQLVLIGALAALVLLMMPSTMFLWELRKLIAP